MGFLYDQLFVSLPYPKADVTGKTVIVTGANVGLGLEAARHFARLRAAKVILAVRSVEKGEEAKVSIESSTASNTIVEVWPLDLTSYDSVKAFVQRAEQLDRVDVLLENAGVATKTFRKAEEDELTITTNVVSTFLLALLMLPKLRATAKEYDVLPHLVIVSSEVHGWTDFAERNEVDIFAALSDPEKADMDKRYPLSKLLEVLYVRELVSHMHDDRVVINLINPGLCHSSLSRDFGGLSFTILKLVLARSTEMGSRTLVHACVAGKESHGRYLSNCQVAEESEFVRSDEGKKAAERIWNQLNAKLEKVVPDVTSV